MDYKAPDNIYWLFSSSAQAIAAFIGFLATGFFFAYDRLDKAIEQDETLEEIYHDIKHQYYKRIIVLFILTGLSIVLSLFIVFINSFDINIWAVILRGIVALINLVTIVWAIYFVIYIINPNKVTLTTAKLIKENKDPIEPQSQIAITRGQFIDRFIELETIIRKIALERNVNFSQNRQFAAPLGLNVLIKGLYQQLLINEKQYRDLMDINKIRNLVVHGEINSIEPKLGEKIDNLTNVLKDKLIK